jgi:hypothetical protein
MHVTLYTRSPSRKYCRKKTSWWVKDGLRPINTFTRFLAHLRPYLSAPKTKNRSKYIFDFLFLVVVIAKLKIILRLEAS